MTSAGAMSIAAGLAPLVPAAETADTQVKATKRLRGSAEHCIMIWLGGGAAQIDTFDPKRRSTGRKDPGSAYDSIPTAIPGCKISEHLRQTAPLLDRAVLMRTLHHDEVDGQTVAKDRVCASKRVSTVSKGKPCIKNS